MDFFFVREFAWFLFEPADATYPQNLFWQHIPEVH